jgi:putative PIN family toxin of toxin-antitoxin system
VRLVLDTNVLLAAVLAPGLCRELVRKHIHAHELCCSPALLEEFAEKLEHKLGVDPATFPFFVAYCQRVNLVEAQPLPAPVCRDPDDDLVLATALAGQAEVIITGDKDLLILKKHQGIRILSPRQFLELLAA